MKIVSHFNDEGPTLKQVVEELLLECCVIK